MRPARSPEEALVEAAERAARGSGWEEALRLLEKALETSPALERAHLSKCAILRALGRREEALKSAEAFTRALPGSARAHHELGVCLSDLEKYGESVLAFRRALELDPKMLQSWRWMGIALGRMGRLEEAFRCYERASGRAAELSVPISPEPTRHRLEASVHELITRMTQSDGGCVRVETDAALAFRASVLILVLLLKDWDMDGVVVSLGKPAEVYRRALASRLSTGHPPHYVEVVVGNPVTPGFVTSKAPSAHASKEITTLSVFEPHRIDAAVRAGLQSVAESYGGEEHFVLVDDLAAMEFYNGREVVRKFVADFLGELSSLGICCFVVLPAGRAPELLGPMPLFCRERLRVPAEWLAE